MSKRPQTAMILAAGFGTRLAPLTDILPKPLFPLVHGDMLGRWLRGLAAAGFRRIVVNAHHLAPLIMEAAERARRDVAAELVISPEEEILGAGGALARAAEHLDGGPFLLVNGDVFTDFDPAALLAAHDEKRLADLALWPIQATANVSVAGENIVAFREPPGRPGEERRLSYGGMMVLSPRILRDLPAGFSDLIDALKRGLAGGERIGFVESECFWLDMGSLPAYLALNARLAEGRAAIHPAAEFAGQAEGFVVVGAGARVAAGARLANSVVWPGVAVGAGASAVACVVARDLPAGRKISQCGWIGECS